MGQNILILGAGSAMRQELVRQQLQQGNRVYTTTRKSLEKQGEDQYHASFNILKFDFPVEFLPANLDGLVYLPGKINLKPFRALKPIAPSLIYTPMSERMINTEDKLEAMKQRHPLKEIGQPRDMASMVSYLLSNK